jgi:hypothetical protein
VAGLSDGRKVVLAAEPGYRESTDRWSTLLRDLRRHGLQPLVWSSGMQPLVWSSGMGTSGFGGR